MDINPRWTRRPEGSTWGDWGPDDQLGRLNLLTPQKVLQGIAEVKTGHNFCLSLPLDYPGGAVLNPRRHPPVLSPTQRGDKFNMNYPMRCDDPTLIDVVSDDKVMLTLQYSTQWDTLAHVGASFDVDGNGQRVDCYYNGFRAGTDVVGPILYQGDQEIAVDAPPGARACTAAAERATARLPPRRKRNRRWAGRRRSHRLAAKCLHSLHNIVNTREAAYAFLFPLSWDSSHYSQELADVWRKLCCAEHISGS